MCICDQEFNLDSNIIIRWADYLCQLVTFGKKRGVANALGLLYTM